MATYSYKCSECGCVFDIQASIKEKEEGGGSKFACPKCRSKKVQQKFSSANFVKNVFSDGDKSGGGCCGPNKSGGGNGGGCCG